MCVTIFSINCVRNIFHSKRNPSRFDRKMYICLHVKYPSFLSDFNKNLHFFATEFRKIPKILNFTKIGPVGSRVVPCSWTEGHD